MKQLSRVTIALSLLSLAGAASAQVVGSLHDLTGAAGVTTTETCVFCHTPHAAATGASVPLWNKSLPTLTTYERYSTLQTSSLDGSEAPVGSVSLACLSCHDGGQAVDAVINSPGRGLGTGSIGAGTTFVSNTTGLNNNALIGTDLTDDHPISIQYAGGGVNTTTHPLDGTYAGPPLGDGDFFVPERQTINGVPAWWVDNPNAGTAGTRDKTDMILYTRDETTVAGGAQPFVECGSCHDPHNSGSEDANNVQFLRVQNQASQICTTCHDK